MVAFSDWQATRHYLRFYIQILKIYGTTSQKTSQLCEEALRLRSETEG
jgi:hypothetical protein